jgi:hypothetical protein
MTNERQVALGGVSEEQAVKLLQTEGLMEGTVDDVAKAVPRFTQKSFKSFYAEYGIVNADLVVHFYLPKNLNVGAMDVREQKAWSAWWGGTFPDVLSSVAQEFFEVEYPRVVAKYTEEVASWWFAARGFASSMDPQKLLEVFLQKMDSALSRPNET